LFLDYRGGTDPKVGFGEIVGNNLQTGESETNVLWWDDFEAFFTELRRGDLD